MFGVLSILVFATLLLTLLPPALAQGETTSAIEGHVDDATAAAIPGARVKVTNRETGPS
jgi:hypothetical protein